jgi:hypothetical protein
MFDEFLRQGLIGMIEDIVETSEMIFYLNNIVNIGGFFIACANGVCLEYVTGLVLGQPASFNTV